MRNWFLAAATAALMAGAPVSYASTGARAPSVEPPAVASKPWEPITGATVVVLTEGFDNITTLTAAGWVMQNNSSPLGSTGWFQGGSGTTFPGHSGGQTSYIGANFNNTTGGTGTISNWLVTPVLPLHELESFSFWTRVPTGSEWDDRLEVRMSTSGSSVGSTADSVGDFTTLLHTVNPDLDLSYPEVWTQITITSFPGATGPGRIAFRYHVPLAGPTGTYSNFIGIDSVLAEVPDGPPPAVLTIGTAGVTGTDVCAATPANQNGIFEPGETIHLTIPVSASNGAFNNVVGTLTSGTAGVTVVTGIGSYGTIAAGTTATANYTVRLAEAVACYGSFDLSLAVSSTEGNFTFPLPAQSVGTPASPGAPANFPVTVGTAIPDATPAGLSSTVTVSGISGPITNVRARVTAAHTWVGDIIIDLTSPAGTTIRLLDRIGVPASTFGCSADNINILFADGQPDPEGLCASWPVTDASPVPGDAFADFAGENANGTWTLTISDNAAGDTGTLTSWELFIEPGAPATPGTCEVCVTPPVAPNIGIVGSGTLTFTSAAEQCLILSNSGDGAGNVPQPVIAGPFALGTGTCGATPVCSPFPYSLAPGASCGIPVALATTTPGSHSGTMTVGNLTASLTGTITAPPAAPIFVPTSSAWMLALMMALMGLVAGVALVRQRG